METLQTVINFILNDLGAAVFRASFDVNHRLVYEDEVL